MNVVNDGALNLSIQQIIEQAAVETHFHPIASIRRQNIIGVEALTRGLHPAGLLIPPILMFEQASRAGLTLELDRLCRQTALRSFAPLHRVQKELILFVNIHASAIDEDIEGPYGLATMADANQIEPRNIVVEILESEIADTPCLQAAIRDYRRCGFLVALDDVGAGHSNLDRIVQTQPDILKADRTLLRGIERDYYKQEVLKSLVHLSEKIGGWVIVEGIETFDEALMTLNLGGDLVQGYYFATPHKPSQNALIFDQERVQDTAARFKIHMLDKVATRAQVHQQRRQVIKAVSAQLTQSRTDQFETTLQTALNQQQTIESACILDLSGMQSTETVWHPESELKQKSVIFRPPSMGDDHSLKEYFFLLPSAQPEPFETAPYVPLPTGALCVTMTMQFHDADNTPFILCLHMNTGQDEI